MIITFGARDGILDLGDTDFVVGRLLGVAEYGKREGFFVDSNCVTLVGTKKVSFLVSATTAQQLAATRAGGF